MSKKKVCQWIRLNDGIYTLCGKDTNFYGDDMKFCPFCGKELIYKAMPRTLDEVQPVAK